MTKDSLEGYQKDIMSLVGNDHLRQGIVERLARLQAKYSMQCTSCVRLNLNAASASQVPCSCF